MSSPSKKRKKSNIRDLRSATKLLKVAKHKPDVNIIPPLQSSHRLPKSTNTQTYVQTKLNFPTIKTNTSSDKYYTLSDNSIDLSLRSLSSKIKTLSTPTSTSHNKEDFIQPDYLKQIGISLRSNFNNKRCRKKANNVSTYRSSCASQPISSRKLRSSTITTTSLNCSPCQRIPSLSTKSLPNNDELLGGYLRCYVEDFMSINSGHDVILLIPKSDNIVSHLNANQDIQIGSTLFNLFKGKVMNSPKAELVKNGISNSDLINGFGKDNYGSYLLI